MVNVNGNYFSTYDLDTPDTFKRRVSVLLDTLPKYLFFPNGLNLSDENIVVENILDTIKQYSKENLDIMSIIKNINSKIPINKREIVSLWFLYNKKLNKQFKQRGNSVIEDIAEVLVKNGVFISKIQVKMEWENRLKKDKNIKFEMDNQRKKVDETLELFKVFQSIEEPAVSLDFHIEYVDFTLTLDIKDISTLELFNSTKVDYYVPYITTNNFFKILKDFVPPTEWIKLTDDNITMKIYKKDKLISENLKDEDFSTAVILTDSKYIKAKITVDSKKDNVSKDGFVNRFLTSFNSPDVKIKETTESKVVGVFYFPLLSLDKYVFSDLVLNNDIFRSLLSIDEHDKATKKKSGLYLTFKHPSTGVVTATLSEKTKRKNDPAFKDEEHFNPEFFPVNQNFIRVRVLKADNKKSVEKFKELLGKLLILYDEKYNEIVSFYRKFIPDFGTVEVEQEEQKSISSLKQSEIAPEIFIKNFSRVNCPPDRATTIITEEEAKDFE